MCVCAWDRVSAAPRHSWLGCWGVCVFVFPLCLYPATPSWGVAVCVCALGLGFRLRPSTPGWGVGVCVCLRACSACYPPLLAGLCGVGVCATARVSAAPRHSWLGCWGVCVFVSPFLLYPATPGWVVRRGCVCLGSGFGCAPPLLAGVLGCVCVCVPAPLVPRHSWLGSVVCVCLCARSGCVCLVLGFGCAPPLLAGVLGCVCVCVPAPLVPRYSWLGCVVWVYVLELGVPLRPATPCWGIGVCVCLCAGPACTPQLRYAPYPLRSPLINFADDSLLTTANRHRDPANPGLPATTEQASAIPQLTTTYLDAHQLLVHPRKSVLLADVGTPAPHIPKSEPLDL